MVYAQEEEEKANPQYVGATRCSVCHKGEETNFIYERWTISNHANAYDNLSPQDRTLPKCLGCHTTGFWEKDKWYSGVSAENLRGVQCEACHGAGSLYRQVSVMNQKLADRSPILYRQKKVKAGLKMPVLEDCQKKCHNANCPKYKPLKLEKSLKETVHPPPRKINLNF